MPPGRDGRGVMHGGKCLEDASRQREEAMTLIDQYALASLPTLIAVREEMKTCRPTVEINNLSEPVETVPMNELSIARYVEPASDTLRKMDGLEWLDSALAEEQENTDAD